MRPRKLAVLTHITKQEMELNGLLSSKLQRAANVVHQFLEDSVAGVHVQVDMRSRPKLGDKMNQLFEINGPQTYAQLLKKELVMPEVHVLVLGSAELADLFPQGQVCSEGLNVNA